MLHTAINTFKQENSRPKASDKKNEKGSFLFKTLTMDV